MEKIRISYSSSKEVKDYLDRVAEKYNMTLSGVITMIIMQHKFQDETMQKFEGIQELLSKINTEDVGNIFFNKAEKLIL